MKQNPLFKLGRTCAALFLGAAALISHASAVAPSPQMAATAKFFQRLDAGENLTVVVYGTSLTAGGAWTGATKDWFNAKSPGKVKFINSGGPGQNSDWGLTNLKAKVIDQKPDLVFVEFSYNDSMDKFKMPVERGAENLDKIVKAIDAANPATVIVLQVMNTNWDAPNGNGSASHRPELEKYNDNYRRYSKEHGYVLLDHFQPWSKLKAEDPKKFESYVPDGTHPSKEGSLAITWPTVKTWLETKGAVR